MKKKKANRATAAARQRANYGSEESRRTCHQCASPSSHVIGTRVTGRLVIRYRKCNECGAKRTTQEIVQP